LKTEYLLIGAWRDEREKGGPKMKVSPTMLLKTHVEKMSLCGLATMLLKKSKLGLVCHDFAENKTGYQ
jgi:hypothetical protein